MAENNCIKEVKVSAYKIPTDYPESDGTLKWDSTTLIIVEIEACGKTGLGYTYADAAAADFIRRNFTHLLTGKNPLDIPALWQSMMHTIRNAGNVGLTCMAVSGVDNALWDLKAKIFNQSLGSLLGMAHSKAAIYGSGGFTSYPMERLKQQYEDWLKQGFTQVKIKIGRNWDEDINRIKLAKTILGDKCELMVDANGAYDAKTALARTRFIGDVGVVWFEEPVSSDDLQGLNFIRNHADPVIKIAAGEYGDQVGYFKNMLDAQAVDVLQADATRSCGTTGFLKAGTLAEATHTPFSFHCAPAIHLYPSLALNIFYIGEYFYDHARIENMLFDGVAQPDNGYLIPDLTKPGNGLEFKHADAQQYQIA